MTISVFHLIVVHVSTVNSICIDAANNYNFNDGCCSNTFFFSLSVCDDPNAEYSLTAPTCSLTCETLGKSCAKPSIRVPGCYCKSGYVQDCDGKCVKSTDYCKTCGDNEYYTACGSNPEASCKNPSLSGSTIVSGCVCRNGYIRDYNNKCVLPRQCPTCWDTNAYYSLLGPTCAVTCETYDANCAKPTVSNPGCYCNPGFLPNCNNVCVKYDEYCSGCDDYEYFSDCAAYPETSCQEPNATMIYTAPGCICKTLYVRDFEKKCVEPTECPSK